MKQEPTTLAHETMGLLKAQKGDFSAAKTWYGEALTLDPQDAAAAAGYALACRKTNDTSRDAEVEAALQEAIDTSSNFAPAYDALATFYGDRDRNLKQAVQLITRAIRLEPDSVQYREDAANILVAAKQVPAAVEMLTAARRLPDRTGEMKTLDRRIAELRGSGAGGEFEVRKTVRHGV